MLPWYIWYHLPIFYRLQLIDQHQQPYTPMTAADRKRPSQYLSFIVFVWRRLSSEIASPIQFNQVFQAQYWMEPKTQFESVRVLLLTVTANIMKLQFHSCQLPQEKQSMTQDGPWIASCTLYKSLLDPCRDNRGVGSLYLIETLVRTLWGFYLEKVT
jgi:hypothetical protein